MNALSLPVPGRLHETNSAFSPTLPGLQIAWDSTSMGTFKECRRKYYYSIVLGWQPRELSVHLFFGQIYHFALEVYDHAKARGADHDEGTRLAVRAALKATWDKAKKKPWISDHSTKNRLTLVRTVVWYLEQFKADPLVTLRLEEGSPAVELSFRFQTHFKSQSGDPFLICGHLDRVARLEGLDQLWIVDRKTTQYSIDSAYFSKYSPDNQMSTYDFAGGIIYSYPIQGVIVDAAQVLVTLSRFERGFVPRSKSQREEWYITFGQYVKEAEQAAKEQNWPMNDKACGHYGGCPFRPVCGRPPEAREEWLRAAYVQRVWDPLKIRGDI